MKIKDMDISQVIIDVVNDVPRKMYDVLASGWGLICSCGVFIGTFLGDRLPLLVYIAIAVTFDGLWGVVTAKRAKKFIFSALIAKSAVKISAYTSIYGLIALIEKGFTNGEFMISSSVIAAILISSELWSILGHIGIAYPDFIVVKLLKKYLKGEMSKKLGIPEEELDDILNKRKDEKTKLGVAVVSGAEKFRKTKNEPTNEIQKNEKRADK